MMSWVFQRRLALEPYCRANLDSCCQSKNEVGVSSWTLFRLYLARVHPLFSISGHHDISVLRVDRVLALLLKTTICFAICYFLLSPVQHQ